MKRVAVGLLLAMAAGAGCGGSPPNEGEQAGGGQEAARFEHLVSWEPSIEQAPGGSRIGFSFTLANRGSTSGEASCEILFRGEPLPGESTTEMIAPGEQAWIRGEAFIEKDPADVRLTHVTPKCE